MRAMRPADLVRGAAALLVLLLLVAGLPVLLVVVSGNPLPGSLPTVEEVRAALTAPDDGTLLLGALTWIAWIGWAVFTASVVADVAARLRGAAAPRLGPQQRLATTLVGAASAIAVAAAAVPQVAPREPPAPTARTSVVALQVVVDDEAAGFLAEEELDDPTRSPALHKADSTQSQPETHPDPREVPAQEPAEVAEDDATPMERAGQAEAERPWRDNLAQQAEETVAGEWRDRISTPFGGQR
jgi:hypothetical protein